MWGSEAKRRAEARRREELLAFRDEMLLQLRMQAAQRFDKQQIEEDEKLAVALASKRGIQHLDPLEQKAVPPDVKDVAPLEKKNTPPPGKPVGLSLLPPNMPDWFLNKYGRFMDEERRKRWRAKSRKDMQEIGISRRNIDKLLNEDTSTTALPEHGEPASV